MWLVACAVASVAIVGCGGGGHSRSSSTVARTMATGCTPAVAAALTMTAAGSAVRSTPILASAGISGCRYAVPGGAAVTVTIDANPQAFMRFNKAVEEQAQVALWSKHPGDSPQMLTGIGHGSDWIPGQRLLLASDGRRLLRVEVQSADHPLAIARATAVTTLRTLSPRTRSMRSDTSGSPRTGS